MGRWSRGMIPRLQRGDQEFESPPAHLYYLYLASIYYLKILNLFKTSLNLLGPVV